MYYVIKTSKKHLNSRAWAYDGTSKKQVESLDNIADYSACEAQNDNWIIEYYGDVILESKLARC